MSDFDPYHQWLGIPPQGAKMGVVLKKVNIRTRNAMKKVTVRSVLVGFIACVAPLILSAGEAGSKSADNSFINSILKHHCISCHGADVSEADIRLDQIDWNDLSGDAENLQEALEQVILDDMPPPKTSTLSNADRAKFHSLVAEKLRRFHAKNREPAAFVPAKLNKAQFIHSLEDLLGIPIPEELASSLPGDKSGDARLEKDVFTTNRNTLSFTLLHYEMYKRCIEEALDLAIPDEAPSMEPFWSYRFDISVESWIATTGKDRDKEVPRLIIRGQVVKDIDPPAGFIWNRSQSFERLPTRLQWGADDYVDRSFLYFNRTRLSPPLPLIDNGFILHPQHSPLEFGRVDVHFLAPNATLAFRELKKTNGVYRLRVHACKGDDNPQHPKLAVHSGPLSYFLSAKIKRAGSPVIVDAPKGEHRPYEFYAKLDQSAEQVTKRGTTSWPLGFLLRNEYFVPDGEKKDSPALHIQRVELDGPYITKAGLSLGNAISF
jgi:hypothetical protein